MIKLWRIICHLAGPRWSAIKTDFEEKKGWQQWKDDGKGWRRGRKVVGGDWRCQREEGFVMLGGFCFLFNFLPPSLPSWHPLYPMSWVSVTFWTCKANTAEWLELSVKVMCCLSLEELGARRRKGKERVLSVENTSCLTDAYWKIHVWDHKW